MIIKCRKKKQIIPEICSFIKQKVPKFYKALRLFVSPSLRPSVSQSLSLSVSPSLRLFVPPSLSPSVSVFLCVSS